MPRQQKAEATKTQLQKQSSQIVMKEPKVEMGLAGTITVGESSSCVLKSQEYLTFETPLAVICPEVLQPRSHNGKSIFKGLLSLSHIYFVTIALEHPIFRIQCFLLWSLDSHRLH